MPEPRAHDRKAAVLLRMSPEDKEHLLAEAADEGISLQVLLERRLLGKHNDDRNPGRKPKDRHPELFRMTG